MAAGKQVAIIGAALDLGAGRRGVDMGPSAIRYAGLHDRLAAIGFDVLDWGDVETAVLEATEETDPSARYLPEIKAACGRVARLVALALGQDSLPLVLGGDHSVALGTLGGLRAPRRGWRAGASRTGDLDAPRDLSPPETCTGCPLPQHSVSQTAASASDMWTLPAVDPSRVALVGLRSLDTRERERIRELGIRAYTMSDIDRIGIERAIRESLTQIAGSGFVHVSLDMDALDPEVAPGVGTPVRGGLSYREAHLALELVAESGLAGSFEVVEVNPILDRANETAALAVELVASALGKTIL